MPVGNAVRKIGFITNIFNLDDLIDTGGNEKEGDSSATEGEGSDEELTTTSGTILNF